MNNTVIYILRHGQTSWNRETQGKHQTHSDGIGNLLTEEGMIQADKAAELLRDIKIDYAFCSPLKRAKQTLERVLVYHPDTVSTEEPRITEMSMYFLDGMAQEQWQAEFPETIRIYQARKKNKFSCTLPSDQDYSRCLNKAVEIAYENGEHDKIIPPWENYKDVLERTKGFVEEIKGMKKSTILISGHQGVNRAILGNLLEKTGYLGDMRTIADFAIQNAAVFRVEIERSDIYLSHNTGKRWTEGFIENL
ncbi:MAG: histidine phosphatase family protein [Nanoarchaeota archaeon]|nr:histidine phosphatase family protein [Nanoarchaeota archaeon]